MSVDIRTLAAPDDCRVAIGRVVEETLAGEITPGEGKRLVELIEKRRTSFEVLDLERQFDYARGRAMFFELLIRHPVGKSRAEDLKAIYSFSVDVQKQNLPEKISDQVLFNYFDYVLEKGKVASTPEGLVHEIEEFLDFMEIRAEKTKGLGPEGILNSCKSRGVNKTPLSEVLPSLLPHPSATNLNTCNDVLTIDVRRGPQARKPRRRSSAPQIQPSRLSASKSKSNASSKAIWNATPL